MIQLHHAIAILAVACCVGLQPHALAANPTVADAEADALRVTVTGEVTQVDTAARVVTIKGPQGRTGIFSVDPAVRNFEQVKVGDRVRIDYRVALALALVKHGDGIREKVEAESLATAQAGAKPGAAALKTTTVVANVLSVDRKRKTARLQGPEGHVVDVQVRDPQLLKAVKGGDQVVANLTETVAVNVRPAPAGK